MLCAAWRLCCCVLHAKGNPLCNLNPVQKQSEWGAQVDIIFALFDVENDGSLACNEFVNVIR